MNSNQAWAPELRNVQTLGSYLLGRWQEEQHLSDTRLAIALGVTVPCIGNWLRRHRMPALLLALRVHALTGIRPEAWTVAYDPAVHAYCWDAVNEELVAVDTAMLPFHKGDGEPCT